MTGASGKSGGSKRAERLKAALRDNLKRRKAQFKGRAQSGAAPPFAPEAAEPPDSAEIGREIASPKP
ncbi:MAG TPA: hypothetical protein VJZ74_05295, partial [Pseudolabrys sp.]|nr:hypothetical protein [Pseudolabrys sp.]